MRLLPRTPLVGVAATALVLSTGIVALAAGSTSGSTARSASSTSIALSGSKPSWATTAHRVGPAKGSKKVAFRVYLRNSDPAGAAAYARAVSTKGNALYGVIQHAGSGSTLQIGVEKDSGASASPRH